MRSTAKRLDSIEESLTPKQAVILWMEQAHQHTSMYEYVKSLEGGPETAYPMYMLPNQVEKAVQDARHGLWYDTPPFKSLNELNQWLQERCQALWQENAHPQLKARSLAQCLEDERAQLMPVPAALMALSSTVSGYHPPA